MKPIISASRRTDIPRFYPTWFGERRRAGHAAFRNAFGGPGSVSLRPEDVLGYLFWTRDARPFRKQLRMLREEGTPYAFHFTINAYGKDLDRHVPPWHRAVDEFAAVSGALPSPACIQWRYDPIVLSDRYGVDHHLRNVRSIAAALKGATQVLNTSFVEPYLKAIRRVNDPTACYRTVDPKRHRTAATRYADLGQVGPEGATLLEGLSAIAAEHGMALRVCSNPEWQMPQAQCCSAELFEPYGARITEAVARLPRGPSRDGCRCLKSIDIGMDNTCLGGCRYCYVVQSQKTALNNFKRHHPTAPMLR